MSLSENDKNVAIGLLIEKSIRNMQQAVKMLNWIIGIWLLTGCIIQCFML